MCRSCSGSASGGATPPSRWAWPDCPRGAEFDLIYIPRYAVARAVIDDAREHSPRAKIVLNVADLHFLRELRAALPARQPDEMRRGERISGGGARRVRAR